MLKDGLIDSFNNYHMGITAENVAEKWNITRKEQDIFAAYSQYKAQDAKKNNRLNTLAYYFHSNEKTVKVSPIFHII